MTVANTLVFIPSITKALRAVKRVLKLIDISGISVAINEQIADIGVRKLQFCVGAWY